MLSSTAALRRRRSRLPVLFAWPSHANFIDVTVSPYNADPTGVADSTSAIQAACNAAATGATFAPGTVWLPAGTYKVTNTIVPTTSGLRLLGAGKYKTTIRLADSSSGFNTGNKPVYQSGRAGAQANQGYANYVQHLTIEIGSGNGAAVALQADMANSGAVEHVRLIAPSGGGRGINLTSSTGNAYGHDIYISGFTYGIYGDTNPANNFIFENVTIENCTTAIHNWRKNLWFQGLIVKDCATVINTVDQFSSTGVINGVFTGGSGGPAIDYASKGFLYLRNIQARGWGNLIDVGATSYFIGATKIVEWSTEPYYVGSEMPNAWSEALAAPVSFNLPIERAPEWHTSDLSRWANVKDYGAAGDGSTDDTSAIQAAIDSGAQVVYFPHSDAGYVIDGALHVRAAVRKVDCCFSLLGGSGSISIDDGTAGEVLFENWAIPNASTPAITKATTRRVSLRNANNSPTVTNSAAGRMFLTNMGPKVKINLGGGATIWIRQLDHASSGDTYQISAATAWIFGDNVEPPSGSFSAIKALSGAVVEVIGGAADAKNNVYTSAAYFQATNSYLSCITIGYTSDTGSGFGDWTKLVTDVFGGNTYNLTNAVAFECNAGAGTQGRVGFPLYISPQWPPT